MLFAFFVLVGMSQQVISNKFLETRGVSCGRLLESASYADADVVEEWAVLLLEKMQSTGAARTIAQNKQAFEDGWSENLNAVLRGEVSAESLKPRYYRPSRVMRLNKRLIVSDEENLEYELFVLVRRWLFREFISDCGAVVEYGCGSCGNLLLLSEMFPGLELLGLDWAQSSVEIAELIAREKQVAISGRLFDMRDPPVSLEHADDAAFLTVHALEQLGRDFQPLLAHLVASKPKKVIHLEPIVELYDPTNLYDYLALSYSKRRGYLDGFLEALRKLEADGVIKILFVERPFIGGVFHESSVIVWEPL